MRLRLVIVPALVAAAFGGGCSLITSYDGYAAGGGAGLDATVDAAPTTEDTLCAPEIPAKPNVTSPGLGLSGLPHFGVVSQMRFVQQDGGCPLGKNLDGLNSCGSSGKTGFACLPVNSDAGFCDSVGGIDDVASGFLLGAPSNASVNLVQQIPADLTAQRTGFLLEISAWAGELNNPQVNVAYYPDIGVDTGDGGADAGTLVDEAALTIGGLPLYQANSAWVTNGVLVANFLTDEHGDPAILPLHFHVFLNNDTSTPSSMNIPISYATLIGVPKLDPVTGGITMTDAQLVGRLQVPQLVTSLTALYGCLNASAAPIVCPLTDLTSMPSTDGTGPTCDALSIALGFDLLPSTLSGSGTAIPATDLCTHEAVDPNLCSPGTTPPVDAGGDDASDATTDADDSGL